MTSAETEKSDARAPVVLIVLLNWNSLEETRAALDAVGRLNYGNYRVLIVDNGSHDGSNVALKKLAGDRVEVLESPVNTGYTGGCNLGLKRALEMGAEYVWLLNNDAVTEPGTLSSLVALAESDPRIGLVTPRIAKRAVDRTRAFLWSGGYGEANLRSRSASASSVPNFPISSISLSAGFRLSPGPESILSSRDHIRSCARDWRAGWLSCPAVCPIANAASICTSRPGSSVRRSTSN